MTPRGWTIFSSLIRHYHAGQEESAINLLAESEKDQFVEVAPSDVQGVVMRPLALVERIHYSWLASLIENDEEQMQALFLGSLPERIRIALQKLIGYGGNVPSYSPAIQKFFRAQLYRRATKGVAFTPAALVAKQSGSLLLTLDKEHLLNTIDFLGIYDLLPLMKESVDQQFLNSIYRELSEHKRTYLQQLLRSKIGGEMDPKGIGKVRRGEQTFARWLHGKGLRRLAILMQGHDDVFQWHLIHTLDTGRADILEKLIAKIEPDEAQRQDVEQKFQHVLSFLKY